MLWSRRNLIFSSFALGASLIGCGFEPVLKEGEIARDILGEINIERQNGENHFTFRHAMIENLGTPKNKPKFIMRYAVSVGSSAISVSSRASITRYTLTGNLSFQIYSLDGAKELISDNVRSVASYSATSTTIPTNAASRDANLRLMRALADLAFKQILINSDKLPL